MATITGTGGADRLLGTTAKDTINGLGGNDRLEGRGGNDTLTGGLGADLLIGGAGNDIYVIDRVSEINKSIVDTGIDTVRSTVTYALGAQQENLTLLGTAARNATGNAKANIITGNAGKNVLSGAGGKDKLAGGGGNDTLIYDPLDLRVDGGLGTDLLRVLGSGITADLTTSTVVYVGMEAIDITGAGDNTLELNATRVLGFSATSNAVRVAGNAGDTVIASDGWVQEADVVVGLDTYARYTRGTAVLLVDLDIDRLGVNLAPSGTDFPVGATEDTPYLFSATEFEIGFSDADTHSFSGVRIDSLPGTGNLTLGGTAVTAGQFLDVAALDTLEYTPAQEASGTPYTAFTFSVKDDAGGFSLAANTVTVNVAAVNDAPSLATNTGMTVTEGGTGVITTARLNEGDPDDSGAALIYTVDTVPTVGELQLNGTALNSGETFTQADINAEMVRYVHDGSDLLASVSFDFTLSDDEPASAPPATFVIQITPVDDPGNDPPLVTVNTGMTIAEGATKTIATAMLDEGDPDNAGAELTYTVDVAPSFGFLELTTDPGNPISSFTQADIDANRVRYVQDGGPNPTDSFDFSLSDGSTDPDFLGTFNITIDVVVTLSAFALKSAGSDTGAASTADGGTDLGHLYYDAIGSADQLQFAAMETPAHHWYLEVY